MTQPQHYFSNAVGSVLYVPNAFVYLHWSGERLESIELRALYAHARNLLERYQIHGILADHRAMPAAFATADREWLLHEWMPHTKEVAEPVRYAVLPHPDPARRLHTEPMLLDLSRYATVRCFTDLEAAAAWLTAPQ